MLRKRLKRPMPKRWKPLHRGIIFESDIKVTKKSRLRAKLLVFKNRWALHGFWRDVFDSPIGRESLGCVNGLSAEVIDCRRGQPERKSMEVDPRYFCVIGLIKGIQSKLGFYAMEYVTHEAVHAAYAYANRRTGVMFPGATDHEEEKVCYPAGRIARQINLALHSNGLY